jgi:hypothetical protein
MRGWKELVAGVVAAGLGFMGASAAAPVPIADPSPLPPASAIEPVSRTPMASTTTTRAQNVADPTTYLVWVSGGLPDQSPLTAWTW